MFIKVQPQTSEKEFPQIVRSPHLFRRWEYVTSCFRRKRKICYNKAHTITEEEEMNKRHGIPFGLFLGGYLAWLGIRMLIEWVNEKPNNVVLYV